MTALGVIRSLPWGRQHETVELAGVLTSSQASSAAPGRLRPKQLCLLSLSCFYEDVFTVSRFLGLIASELDYPTMMSALMTQGIKHSPRREELTLESVMNDHDSQHRFNLI